MAKPTPPATTDAPAPAPLTTVRLAVLVETVGPEGNVIEGHREEFGATTGVNATQAHAAMAPHLAAILSYRESLRRSTSRQ